MSSLQAYSPTNLALNQNELSIYNGNLTDKCLVESSVKIKKAFPSLPVEFYDVFMDRIRENGFNDDRLKDAVNNVIDNCVYPTPTIAQFISFDKRIKLYKYPDIVQMVDDGDLKAFDRYKRIVMDGLPEAVWIHVNDIAKYKIV